MNPEVLILAGLYDFSADLVVAQLEDMGVTLVRINREELVDYRLSIDPLSPALLLRREGLQISITPSSLRSIWYRQPIFLRNTPPVGLSPAEQLGRSQWAAFLRSFMVFSEVAWMNHPQATYAAECKPFQLLIAQQCGFKVPATLVTNDAKMVHESFSGPIVVKSLDTVLLMEGEDCLFTYTTIAKSDLLADQNTSAAPLIAQHALSEKSDLRITVVGDEIFATRITVGGKGVIGDWRVVVREDLTYEDIQLDASVADCCLRLAQRLGLSFAAIDLIEAPTGTYFVEVNPTGEWGWLNSPSRRIDIAIAKWLSRGGEKTGCASAS